MIYLFFSIYCLLHIFSTSMLSCLAAIGLYGKPFPHFDSSEIVFGKDRVTSVHVENPADVALAMQRELHQTMPERVSLINLDSDENNFESQIPEIPTYNTFEASAHNDQPQGGGTISKSEKRSRKGPSRMIMLPIT